MTPIQIKYELTHESGRFLLRMLLLLYRVRTSIQREPNFICNEVRYLGRGNDNEAMNSLVLWIAHQMGASVYFTDGEFTCSDTIAEYMDRETGSKAWRDELSHITGLHWRMRLAWIDKMVDTLETLCRDRGVDVPDAN